MPTLQEINDQITELRRKVPRGSVDSAIGTVATIGDVEVAYNLATGEGVALPTGGKMIAIFNQACPTGWTRVSALDDKFLRCAATYGGTGGSSGTHTHTCSGVVAHTHTVSYTTASDGAHTHSYSYLGSGFSALIGTNPSDGIEVASATGSGGGGSHTHAIGGNTTSTGDASFSSGAQSMLPEYIEVVLCSKD